MIFEPLDFIARLAALVPKPRFNLTRFHGVFAPNSKYSGRVAPGKRGRGHQDKSEETRAVRTLRRDSLGVAPEPARLAPAAGSASM